MQDTLFGTTRLVCLNLRTQQVVWDTDFGEPGVAMRKLECWERNFAFAGPPLVRGDRVYAGVGTSPMGEEESRVICFDRRTGVVLWERFLASVTTGRPMWGGGGGTFTSRLTVLEEDRGVLVAHSNLGAVAALDAVTGHVQWLSKYQRSNLGQNQGWGGVQVFSRPASPLVLHRGKMFALPQDRFDLLVVDLATGRIQSEPGKIETALDTPAWKDFHRLVGRMGDYLVFGSGRECCILNTATGKSHGLTVANTIGTGRGTIDGETLYLPCTDGGRGGLGMYYGQKMWRPFEQSIMWWQIGFGEGGNIARAGNYLLYATGTKLFLYTDSEIVRAEFRRRLEQSPPNPAAWLDYGQLMRENQKWAEAARGYLSFIEAVAGDSEWMARAREVRTELHGIFLKLGLESTSRKAHADAAAHFGRARDFAWDGPTLTEATRLLAGACESAAEANSVPTERRAWARRAVEEYQELVRRSPPGFVKPGEAMVWHPIRRFASSRIAGLMRKHGADAYAGVARAAEQELKRAGKNPAALKALADLYPESAAAIEALDLLAKQAESQGRWTAVAAALREIRSRLGDRWTPAQQKRLHDALEKSGDGERLDMELSRMEQLFEGAVRLGPEENDPTVAEYLQKARAAAASVRRRPAEPPPGSTATLSTWEPAAAVIGPLDLAVGWDLVAPGGLEPPKWPADFEFFARGSTIELWNIRSKKRVWTEPHPGGWMGLAFTEPPTVGRGVRVTVVAPGSPAARAGLQDGDVIRSVDGVEVSESDFDLASEGRAAGARLSIVYERGGETRRTDVTTAAWPAASRPAIVGAVFTGEGAIAVAWEDCVAAFDSADGRHLWTSRPLRSRFVLRAVHASADRVLAHEHHVPDKCRSAFRFIGERGAKAPLPAEDQNSRVLALDDSDGEPAWALGFRFDPATASHHAVRFLGGPLDSHAGVVVSGYQNNLRTVEVVPVSVADGREKEQGRIALTGTGGQPASAWTVDPATGTLWVVDAMGRDQRKLRSFTRPDYARGPEITLEPHVDPMAIGFGLAANADRIAVVSLSRHAAPPRVAVFSVRDGKVLASHRAGEGPLKDRLMPGLISTAPELRLIGGLLTMEPDGMLILYNESKSAPGAAATVKRASLTALSVAGGGLKIEWDAVTPTLISQAFADRDVLSVRSGPKGFFVTTFRGIPPGKSDEATVFAFHGRKEEGAVRKMIDDLVITTDTNGFRRDPAPARRGRIFLNRKGGLEILGD